MSNGAFGKSTAHQSSREIAHIRKLRVSMFELRFELRFEAGVEVGFAGAILPPTMVIETSGS